jgi:glycine/D-amino acid oxidase-like deaminating enzyme
LDELPDYDIARAVGPEYRRVAGATQVLIVGGGASGVLLAIHLLRGSVDQSHVTILERRPTLGAGIAYATNQIAVIATGNKGPGVPREPWRFDGWSDD